jgi:hypothetical protein
MSIAKAFVWRSTFIMARNGRVESFFVVMPVNLKFAGRAGTRSPNKTLHLESPELCLYTDLYLELHATSFIHPANDPLDSQSPWHN